MVDEAMYSLESTGNYHWGGIRGLKHFSATFPSTSNTKEKCETDTDQDVHVRWTYISQCVALASFRPLHSETAPRRALLERSRGDLRENAPLERSTIARPTLGERDLEFSDLESLSLWADQTPTHWSTRFPAGTSTTITSGLLNC